MPEAPPGAWKASQHPGITGPALIDTHVWLWYLDGASARMARATIELIRRIARSAELVVSEMSVWELANKAAKGRLSLMPSTEVWIARATVLPGYRFALPDRETLLLSTRLPGLRPTDPTDPIDRMLLATALRDRLPLITADKGMIGYARRTRRVSVCDARP